MKAIWLLPVILHLVLASSEESFSEDSSDEDDRDYWAPQTIISKMNIKTEIANRYAITTVESYVNNPKTKAHETNFTVVLPTQAFISKFIMKIGDVEYPADISEKDEAKNKYLNALKNGQAAGHISARDTNTFMVSVNVKPLSEVKFFLTYEELLDRKNSQYELVINIFPGQVVNTLNVKVHINESRPLDFVKTPLIRSGQKIEYEFNENLDPTSRISMSGKKAIVDFTPTPEEQEMFAKELGKNKAQGLPGQFVVNYDVKRGRRGSELLVQDNFFACFVSVDSMPPLPKHIVFVLDTSGSMEEEIKRTSSKEPKTTKLKLMLDAMEHILDELQANDKFNIIQFSTYSYVLDFDKDERRKIKIKNYRNPFTSMNMSDLAKPFSKSNVGEAINILNKFAPRGGTNIIGALETALATINLAQKESNKNLQPIIMFLTDGISNVGIKEPGEIVQIIRDLNHKHQRVPIYTLSFGDKTNQKLLNQLSVENYGKSKHIYEASDASLQLQEFYNEISVPLLKDVNFFYKDETVNISKTQFPVLFKGSELAVCGYYNGSETPVNVVSVTATGYEDNIHLQSTEAATPVTSIERLCAFLTMKQRLSEGLIFGNEQLTKQGLDLALKYSFVTDLTSLVVVKPERSLRFYIPDVENRFKTPPDSEELQILKEVLPWLGHILDSANIIGTIEINQNIYYLGEKYTSNSNNICLKTPLTPNSNGTCRLLKDCSEVWEILENYQTYQQYFCVVDDKYAGVCCPEQ